MSWHTISLEDSALPWTLCRHEKLLIFIRLQPSSWEKSIYCVCPGDYFISSVTDTGQFMAEMSIFFLWIITRQFRDANSNGDIISLAIIVREFKVQYMHVYMIHVYRALVLLDMFKCHYCYINHNFAKILISMNKEQLNLKSFRYVYTCICSGPMELICYIRNLLYP